MLAWLVL